MLKLNKIKWGLLILLLGCLLGTQAMAGNIALRAGFTPPGYSSGKFTFASGSDGYSVKNNSGTDLSSGYAVECYWMGTDGFINDPDYSGTGADVLIGTIKYTGDDSDTWNAFISPPIAGKFFHDYTASGSQFTLGSNIYFRVWDNVSPSRFGALFGESRDVTASFDDSVIPIPNNHGLRNIADGNLWVQFTQGSPEAPTLGTVTPHQASPSGSPSIDIGLNSSLHGRWYDFEVSAPETSGGATFTFNGYRTAASTNDKHAADINTSTGKSSGTITLNQTDDDKFVKVRVRAANDYGTSGWTEGGPYHIPPTTDNNIPVAITDLQVSTEGNNIVLSWSAPYDNNSYGHRTDCSAYSIRVSKEAIVDVPASPFTTGQTNPGNISNWGTSLPIESYFTPAPIIPTPLTYGTKQSVTIVGAAGQGPLLFGIKSQDASGNWSYISNVAGIGGAGGGGWAADISIAFNSGIPVLSWSGNSATYDIWAAGNDEVYSLLAGGVAGTTYRDSTASGVSQRFYQVKPAGSQSGTQVVGMYNFNFTKQSGKTGINTFAIPFGSNVKGQNVSSISSADDIINDIGINKVEYVGRWNEAEQKAEGRVVYTPDPSQWYGPNFSIEKGKSYQISVSDNVTWIIIGKK